VRIPVISDSQSDRFRTPSPEFPDSLSSRRSERRRGGSLTPSLVTSFSCGWGGS
jgi:hypothetical protein